MRTASHAITAAGVMLWSKRRAGEKKDERYLALGTRRRGESTPGDRFGSAMSVGAIEQQCRRGLDKKRGKGRKECEREKVSALRAIDEMVR